MDSFLETFAHLKEKRNYGKLQPKMMIIKMVKIKLRVLNKQVKHLYIQIQDLTVVSLVYGFHVLMYLCIHIFSICRILLEYTQTHWHALAGHG